ncbi:MAG: hypothetical protein V1765_01890 [bacterium]
MLKRIIRIFIIVELILLGPFILTLLNPNARINGGPGGGWDWSPYAFVGPMAALLFVTGLAIDLAARKITKPVYRIGTIIAIVLVLLLIWIQIVTGAVSLTIQEMI